MTRIVSVFGATGTQGSAVVNALLADGTFTPRALTRNPASPVAQALKERGVEVIQADLWDKRSLIDAMAGSEGVFGITNYYDPSIAGQNPRGEIEQGKILIDAAKAVGVNFFVWSSLPSSTEISKGKYRKIFHFDNKAAVDEYLKTSGLRYAILHTGWFTSNCWNYGNLVKTSSGALELQVALYAAHSNQAILDVERDLGQCVLALLKNPDEAHAQTFYAVTARMTYPAFAQVISRNVGKPVKFVSTPTTGMEELDEMYAYQSEFGLYEESAIPDPRLVAFGMKFSSLDHFAVQDILPRFVAEAK